MVTKAFYVQKVLDGSHGAIIGSSGEQMHGAMCQIRDNSLGSTFKIQVPKEYTVYQTESDDETETVMNPEIHPSSGSVLKDPSDETKHNDRRMKLKFLLIGSTNPTDLSLVDIRAIDRVEFHGSICSDFVVFDVTRVLPSIRKVKLFFGRKQTPTFQPWIVEEIDRSFVNKSVTSLTIIADKGIGKKVTNKEKRAKLETTIEEIIVQIIEKTAHCFPYLRKIVLDIPFSVRLERAAVHLRDELVYLKPTLIETDKTGDRLLARKQEQTYDAGNCMVDTDGASNTTCSLSPTNEDFNNEADGLLETDGGTEKSNASIDMESNPKDVEKKTLQLDESDVLNTQLVLPINSDPIQPKHSDKVFNSGVIKLTSGQFDTEPSSTQIDDASPSLTGLGKLLESMLGVSQLEFPILESAAVCDKQEQDVQYRD